MPYVKEIQAFLATQGLNVSLDKPSAVVNTHNVKNIIQAELQILNSGTIHSN